MIGEQNTEEEPTQIPPLNPRGHQPPAQPTPSDAGDEHAEADMRTLPFPYAERFDDWVADETAASEARDDRRDAGSRDAPS